MDQDTLGPAFTAEYCFRQTVNGYGLTFDKSGKCTSPLSLDHLISFLAGGGATDVILYAHGWNTDWPSAQRLYQTFLDGVSDMAATHPGRVRDGFRPVFVGIHWPSVILLWPSERIPDIAADLVAEEADPVAVVSEELPEAERGNFDVAMAKDEIGVDEARDLAALVAPHLAATDDATEAEGAFDAEDLLTVWRAAPEETASGTMDEGGFEEFGDGEPAPPREGPAAAGLLDQLAPRQIARLTTVLIMKDRAGVVGANGVAEVLRRIHGTGVARLHLVGHSYGAKVVMTALVKSGTDAQVASVLLLQPAVSHLAFAADAGDGRAGAFRSALPRVARPILSTYSTHDFPLRQVFHLAARRRTDIGELQVLGGPPSKYAALGGYGPSGLRQGESLNRPMPAPGEPYGAFEQGVKIVGLDGSAGFKGHSDVGNVHTFWAMLGQLG